MTPRLLRPRDSSSRKTWCARTRFGFRFAVHHVSLPLRLFRTRAERLAARRRSRCALELAGPGSPRWTLDRRSVTIGRQLPRWRHSHLGSLSLRDLRSAGHSIFPSASCWRPQRSAPGSADLREACSSGEPCLGDRAQTSRLRDVRIAGVERG
jgi:hypothetical protein